MKLTLKQRISFLIIAVLACLMAACGSPFVAPTATPAAPTATPPPTMKPQTTAVVAPQGLVGGVWTLLRFELMSGKVTPIDQPDKYSVEFQADGKVQIKADCNTGSGVYKANGDRLTIENIGLTKMACPAGSQGDKFVQSLGMAISYVLDGGELTITMSYDAGDMVLGKGK